mgnify:CR=1 FL=1
MKKIIIVMVAICNIYSSIIEIVNNVNIIVEVAQSAHVRTEGLLFHLSIRDFQLQKDIVTERIKP